MLELEPFEALALSLHHSPGVMALLVGSGLSRTAGVPTGWEITLDLVRRLGVLKGVAGEDDWAAWYHGLFGTAPDYSELLDALASTTGERRNLLQSYIEAKAGDEERRPTRAHHAIAKLVADGAVQVIVTTNFDRLLESALRDAGIEPTVIAHEDALAGATPLVHSRCTVVKLHGDYLDERIRNTATELAAYAPVMDRLLDEVFDRYGLLVAGWSGEWDEALRRAVERCPTRRYPFYWAARGPLSRRAADLVAHRQGRVIDITDADAFFGRLAETLAALKEADRPHPLSVAATMAVGRRYCRDDRLSPEWTELLAEQTARVRGFVTAPEYGHFRPDSPGLNSLVNRTVERSEPFRRLCLVAGRWGEPEAVKSMVRALRAARFSQGVSGSVYTIRLRDLGASLAWTWALLGAVAGERWTVVRQLQEATLRTDRSELPFAVCMPLFVYPDVDWRFLEGFERQYTPASDFLLGLFRREAGDIALAEGEATDTFNVTEILTSLEIMRFRLDEVTAGRSAMAWAPKGRFSWNGDAGLLPVLAALKSAPDSHAWAKAGLLGGEPETVRRTAEAFEKFLQNN